MSLISGLHSLLDWWKAQTPRYYDHARRCTNQNAQEAAVLDLRKRLGPELQRFFRGYGTCERCDWPWPLVLDHTTQLGGGHGCFPLCEKCWRELGTSTYRLPYYRMAWEKYWRGGEPWAVYEAAVKAEDASFGAFVSCPEADLLSERSKA